MGRLPQHLTDGGHHIHSPFGLRWAHIRALLTILTDDDDLFAHNFFLRFLNMVV